MNWLQTLAVVFHVLFAAAIVGLVLLQRGKGADAGAGFGAGASGTVFGARGSASFLSRTTAVLATLFFLSSLGLSYMFSQQKTPTSVMDRLPAEAHAPMQTDPASQLPMLPQSQPAPATAPASAPASEPGTAPAAAAQQPPAAKPQAPAPAGGK
jgi:preprotein translocase subunit SecG